MGEQAGIHGFLAVSPCLAQRQDQQLPLLALSPGSGNGTRFPLSRLASGFSGVPERLCLSCCAPSSGMLRAACLHKACCGAVSSSFQKIGQLAGKLVEGQTALFSLRKPDQGQGFVLRDWQETQEFMQPSCGELGKLPTLIRLKELHRKGMVPL